MVLRHVQAGCSERRAAAQPAARFRRLPGRLASAAHEPRQGRPRRRFRMATPSLTRFTSCFLLRFRVGGWEWPAQVKAHGLRVNCVTTAPNDRDRGAERPGQKGPGADLDEHEPEGVTPRPARLTRKRSGSNPVSPTSKLEVSDLGLTARIQHSVVCLSNSLSK